MPRKKKKSSTPRAQFVEEGAACDVRGGESSPSSTTKQPPKVNMLSVRLGKTRSKKASPMIPHVMVSEYDAERLNLHPEDEVLLLSCGMTSITGAVLGKTEISKSSRRSPAHSEVRTAPLSSGTIQVTPSSLIDVLFRREEVPESTDFETVSPSTPTTPPSDKKSFSFKLGGGGDQLYSSPSPSQLRQSSPALVTPTKLPMDPLWIIPISSKLGRGLARRICTGARMVVVKPLLEDSLKRKPGWEKAVQVIKRLVLAYCVERYIQKGEQLRISFQGKPLDLIVEKIEGLCSRTESIEDDFAGLSLNGDNDVNGTEFSEDEQTIWKAVTASDLRLYKVKYETEVTCLLPDPVGSDEVSSNTEPRPVLVAGLSETLQELRSLLRTPLERPELFARGGMKPPKGVLLHGPSGVGKTLLARKLAKEFEPLFIVEVVNGSSLQSKTAVVGEAERCLSKCFNLRSNERGKLLIFDDVHLICPRRGRASGTTDRLAATLLALLDGIESSGDENVSRPLVVLAITQNPSLLDPALRRPGRLDAEIEVPLPDEPSTRAEIIKYKLQELRVKVPDFDDNEWLALGKLAKGFNGADCSLAAKEAVRCALLRNAPPAGPIELDKPLELRLEDLQTSIRSTKPSAIKSITVEIPQVKWSSIGGMESVKRELREAIELPTIHQAAFQALGVPPPRGILLYGPPGCSKTLMARALATEGKMNFLAVKGPELLSKWLGESERALASLFRRARMASPSIIFFDEIDSIAAKRGSGDSPSSGRLLSQLLTELDGINHTGSAAGSRPHRVVVIGATNRPDLLDTALTRPGRIDRMIYVGVPDCESRAKIFELSLRGKSCSDDIGIERLASDATSQGFSGAEVVAICRDAALLALEESDDDPMVDVTPKIEMRHLLRAIDGMHRQITPEMLNFYASYRESTTTSG